MRYQVAITFCTVFASIIANMSLLQQVKAIELGNAIHVAQDGTDSATCGATSNPCKTIQQAINLAQANDTIMIARGTYVGSDKAVAILPSNKPLMFLGGFVPPNWDTATGLASETIIDGGNARRGFVIRNTASLIALRNLTIQNGRLTDGGLVNSTDAYAGGGLICTNTTQLTLTDVIFRNNAVERSNGNEPVSGGGAAFYAKCPTVLENVIFESNRVVGGNSTNNTRGAQALGGGFHATIDSHITANRLTLINNSVQGGSGGVGYKGNTYDRADGLGGGAAIQYSTANMNFITVTGNTATGGNGSQYGAYGAGGGLFFEHTPSATVTGGLIANNTISGGNASAGEGGVASGGGLMSTDATLKLYRLYIINNASVGGTGSKAGSAGGGGLYFTKAAASNTSNVDGNNLIIADNRAEAGSGNDRWGGGGGVFSQNTILTLDYTTLANNKVLSTMTSSGLITLNYLGSSRTTMRNSIVSGHIGFWGAILSQGPGDSITLDHTLFFNNEKNTEAQLSGAVLTTNNSHGGDPQYVSAGAPSYDYHLQSSSSAKDNANGTTLNIDIDGDARPYASVSDIGADEYVAKVPKIDVSFVPTDRSVSLQWSTNLAMSSVGMFEVIISCPSGANPPEPVGCAQSMNMNKALQLNLISLTNYAHYGVTVTAKDANGTILATSSVISIYATDRYTYLPLVVR